MEVKETPLHLEGINDNIYAGFGPRFASLLLDALIFFPIGLLILYLNSSNLYAFYYTIIPNIFLSLVMHVYLPKRYGGTPGKLIMGLKIIRLDGKPIGWNEAILRHLVLFVLTVFTLVATSLSIQTADPNTYVNLSWLQQTQYLQSFYPTLFVITLWANNIWVWGELLVLLTNSRKRAIHDFIASTVIVKSIYINRINEVMYPEQLKVNE